MREALLHAAASRSRLIILRLDDTRIREHHEQLQCGRVKKISLNFRTTSRVFQFLAERARSSPSTRDPTTTRKVSPKMLRYHATRAATRVAMLAAIPGIGTARAVAILRAYPTFRELVAAKHGQLAGLVVRKSPLGEELAVALHRVLH